MTDRIISRKRSVLVENCGRQSGRTQDNLKGMANHEASQKQRLFESYDYLNRKHCKTIQPRQDRYENEFEELFMSMKSDIENMKYHSTHVQELQQQLKKFRDDIGNLTEICTNTINTVVDLRNEVQMLKAQFAEYKLCNPKTTKKNKKKYLEDGAEPNPHINRIESLNNCQLKSFAEIKRSDDTHRRKTEITDMNQHCSSGLMYGPRNVSKYSKSRYDAQPNLPDQNSRREFYSPFLSPDGITQITAFEMLARNENYQSKSFDPNSSTKNDNDFNTAGCVLSPNKDFCNRNHDSKIGYSSQMQYQDLCYNGDGKRKKSKHTYEENEVIEKKVSSKQKPDVPHKNEPRVIYTNESRRRSKTKRRRRQHDSSHSDSNKIKIKPSVSSPNKGAQLNRYKNLVDESPSMSNSLDSCTEVKNIKDARSSHKKTAKDINASDKSSTTTIKSNISNSGDCTSSDSESDSAK